VWAECRDPHNASSYHLERIAAVAPSCVAAGERYDETGMRFVNG
jgi:hypothetical protein